jgi:hypothetical protein
MKAAFATLFVACVLCIDAGCAGIAFPASQPSVGWSFYIGRPSTVITQQPAILNQSNGPVGVQPMGSLNGVSPSVIHTPPPSMPAPISEAKRQLFVCPPACPPCPPCQPAEGCGTGGNNVDRQTPAREE